MENPKAKPSTKSSMRVWRLACRCSDKSIIKGYRDGLITEQTALAYASQRSIVRRGIDEFNYAIGVAKDELGVKLAIDQEYDQRIYEERQKVGSR